MHQIHYIIDLGIRYLAKLRLGPGDRRLPKFIEHFHRSVPAFYQGWSRPALCYLHFPAVQDQDVAGADVKPERN